MYVRFEIFAHESMSFWKGALVGSENGKAKLHSMLQRRMMTFGRGTVLDGAGRVYCICAMQCPKSSRHTQMPQDQDENIGVLAKGNGLDRPMSGHACPM